MKRIQRDDDLKDDSRDIFENPVTKRPWHDERSQRDHYWKPTLRKLGLCARRSYCTRHTFCSIALSAGIWPAYIASQAGHTVQTLLSTYQKWIPDSTAAEQQSACLRPQWAVLRGQPKLWRRWLSDDSPEGTWGPAVTITSGPRRLLPITHLSEAATARRERARSSSPRLAGRFCRLARGYRTDTWSMQMAAGGVASAPTAVR